MRNWPWHSAGQSGSWTACSTTSGTAQCGCRRETAPPPGDPGCDACTASPPAAAAARAWRSWAPWSSRSRPPHSTAHTSHWAPMGPSQPLGSCGSASDWAPWPQWLYDTPSGHGGGGTLPRCHRGWSRRPDVSAGDPGSPACRWVWCSGCPRSRTGGPGRCYWSRSDRSASETLDLVSPHICTRREEFTLMQVHVAQHLCVLWLWSKYFMFEPINYKLHTSNIQPKY